MDSFVNQAKYFKGALFDVDEVFFLGMLALPRNKELLTAYRECKEDLLKATTTVEEYGTADFIRLLLGSQAVLRSTPASQASHGAELMPVE